MPEQKLNPEALEPLYGLAKLCIRYLNRDDCPETTSRLRTAIALAESTPEQQSPSGAMTMERARAILHRVWVLMLDPSQEPWSELQERVAQQFQSIDRAARLETLEWVQTLHAHFGGLVFDGEIARRLKEIKEEHR